jgi:hypothetical protein
MAGAFRIEPPMLDLQAEHVEAAQRRVHRPAFALSPITVATVARGSFKSLILLVGGPERTRTSDLRFRKPLLYPAELRDRDRRADIA